MNQETCWIYKIPFCLSQDYTQPMGSYQAQQRICEQCYFYNEHVGKECEIWQLLTHYKFLKDFLLLEYEKAQREEQT